MLNQRAEKLATRKVDASVFPAVLPLRATPTSTSTTLEAAEILARIIGGRKLTALKDAVGLGQSFFGTNVVPNAGHGPGVNGRAGVKPLHQSSGLVRIVSLRDVLLDERHGAPRII